MDLALRRSGREKRQARNGNKHHCDQARQPGKADCQGPQKTSGEPFEIGVLIKAGTLRFTTGAPTYYQSSSFGKRGFCAVCGSRLLWAPTDTGDEWATNVAVCALDNPADVRPCCHTYADTKLPWLHIPDDLPSFTEAEMPPVIERWKRERS